MATSADQQPDKYHAPHSGILLVAASNTEQKPVEYDAIGYARQKQYGGIVASIALGSLSQHPSPEEDKESCRAISSDKLAHARPLFIQAQKGGALSRPLNRILSAYGIASGQQRDDRLIIIFGEDAIAGVPKNIFPWFSSYVLNNPNGKSANPKLLAPSRLEPITHEGINYVGLLDFGPIKDAIGVVEYANAIRFGALKAGYGKQRVPTINKVSYALARLSDPYAENEPIIVHSRVFLDTSRGLKTPFVAPDAPLHVLNHFMCTEDNPHRPIESNPDGHLTKGHFRQLGLDKMVAWTLAPASNVVPLRRALRQLPKPHAHLSYNVVQVTEGSLESHNETDKSASVGKIKIHKRISQDFERFLSSMSLEFDLGTRISGQSVIETVGGVIVPPRERSDHLTTLKTAVSICNLGQHRQFDDRYQHPFFVNVINRNGCHNDVIALVAALSNNGYSADFTRRPLHHRRRPHESVVKVKGVTHSVTRYLNVLDTQNRSQEAQALSQLLPYQLKALHRFNFSPEYIPFDQAWAVDKNYRPIQAPGRRGVTILTSAYNENRSLSDDLRNYGQFLAEARIPAAYGDMERPPGLDFRQSYLQNGGPFLFTSTAERIARKEKRLNFKPLPAHEAVIRRTLPERMDDLLGFGRVKVDAPGGQGTFVETGTTVVAKHDAPNRYSDDAVIFHMRSLRGIRANPWLYSTDGLRLKIFLGEEKANLLVQDHRALENEGFYLASNFRELRRVTLRALEKTPSRAIYDTSKVSGQSILTAG